METAREKNQPLKEVVEVRKRLRDIVKEWDGTSSISSVTQEDVNELNEIATEFEIKFKEYEKAKLKNEVENRVKSFKLNVEAAEQLNEIFQELKKPDGSLEIGCDYKEDTYFLDTLNAMLPIPQLVGHMKEFIRLAESK